MSCILSTCRGGALKMCLGVNVIVRHTPTHPTNIPPQSFQQRQGGIDSTLEAEIKQELSQPTPVRMWAIAKAFEQGMGVEEVHELTSIWVRTRCW